MSIPRRFYSWFMLIFVANTILSGRDWGPMHAAERRARQGRGVAAAGSAAGEAPEEPPPYYTQVQTETFAMIGIKPGIPCRMVNAALPFFIFVVLFIPLLFYHGAEVGCDGGAGWGGSARDIIGCAEAFPVLHWTAATVICFQIVFYMCQYDKAWGGCLLRPAESIDAALNGSILYFKAAVALLLAFTYAQTVKDLQLGVYLVDLLGDSVSEAELPMLVFILCAIFSLATGTSWGTMTVFMPAVIPLAEAVGGSRNVDLLVTTMSAVLGGAVWGDHCSPVSDTTILSAASCQVSLMDHAKTQIPYALFSGLAAILLGFWPCGAGVPSGVCILIGLVVIPLLHYLLSLLGRVIPGFGGTVEVYHPLRGRSIGEGFAGTRAALRSAVARAAGVPHRLAGEGVRARRRRRAARGPHAVGPGGALLLRGGQAPARRGRRPRRRLAAAGRRGRRLPPACGCCPGRRRRPAAAAGRRGRGAAGRRRLESRRRGCPQARRPGWPSRLPRVSARHGLSAVAVRSRNPARAGRCVQLRASGSTRSRRPGRPHLRSGPSGGSGREQGQG
ncbi:unnamed protein product [Prorocentrum cordatum]|uniref:Na+/H+ antiporter NhaC-like C-terminal domain-containing protein n=1 Tax=Prorocentrum cordatum TaxID=2364126 RepID=A0ABN9PXH2_9DINO|nr:unnamed protein product [Polarella glacialis]